MTDEKYNTVRENAEALYGSIGPVQCPYLNETVSFNARGWEHLLFKSRRQARTRQDQYIRMRLVELAPKIIRKSHTLQGKSEQFGMEPLKSGGKWSHVRSRLTFYEFIAVVGDHRVRVIVKRVGDGPAFFWSIIPFWKVHKMTKKRLLSSGKPALD